MKNVTLLSAMVLFFLLINFVFAIDTPTNIQISHDGDTVEINWDAVAGATFYKVYTCDTPNGEFIVDETGSFPTPTSWLKSDTSSKKFYQVYAVSGQTIVNLGTADNYVILAKSGISTIPNSAITGNIGISPAAASFITGFSLLMDPSGTFSTSTQVVGQVYASDYTSPTPSNLTTAIGDMQTAYTDAAGRLNPDFLNLGAGDVSGLTLVPGLYKWGTGILISSSVTLNGGQDEIWIFQIAEGITMAPGASVILAGGAQPQNIFWQSVGVVSLDTGAHLEGIVLCSTAITLGTGATVNGRLLAQTAVTLDQSAVTQPEP
jgi:hypothetical protein